MAINLSTLDPVAYQVQREIESSCRLGESPGVTSGGELTWVDCERGELLRFSDAGLSRTAVATGLLSAALPDRSGGHVLFQDRLMLGVGNDREPARILAELPEGLGDARFNDAKPGPDGRIWATTVADRAVGTGGLWSYHPDEGLVRRMGGLLHGNGIGWTVDSSAVVVVDSVTGVVAMHSFEGASGNVGDPEPLLTLPRECGLPDGLAMDSADGVWLAIWGGYSVVHLEAGHVRGRIDLPQRNITSCAFVDADTLLVTSAADDVDADGPGGSTWLIRVDRTSAPVPLADILAPRPATI